MPTRILLAMIDPSQGILESLSASKLLAEELRNAIAEDVTKEKLEHWYKAVSKLNRAFASELRKVKAMKAQNEIEVALVNEALRDELIDREGNAARISDKQRSLFENRCDTSKSEMAAFDRVETVVMNIERSLGMLNACSADPGEGCKHLAL